VYSVLGSLVIIPAAINDVEFYMFKKKSFFKDAQNKLIEDAQSEEKIVEEIFNQNKTSAVAKVKEISILIIAFVFVAFQLYTTIFLDIPEAQVRAIHLAFVIAVLFIIKPASKKYRWFRIFDVLLGVGGVVASLYLVFNAQDILRRGGMPNSIDLVLGIVLIIVILEGTRRTSGASLCILAVLFILYAKFGSIFPGVFAHPDFRWTRIIDHLYLSLDGIFGIALSVSATFLYLFILFGSFLSETGAVDLFLKVGLAVAGKSVGGQAKVAVVASALLGTVTGSSPANVATTGNFTIPLMIRSGYSREFAGAVEAVASTGGQIMPPVMGVAAFIMAQYLNVPYSEIAVCAIIPALLYYIACWAQIHFHSARIGLKGMDAKDIPKIKEVLKTRGHMLLPLVFLVVMICAGYSAMYAAFFTVIVTLVCSLFKKETRLSSKKFKAAIVATAVSVAPISIATAVVGIVVGIISLTGTALLVGNSVISLAGNNVAMVLLITMVISILLGMGLPTSAVYIVAATFAAPVIIRLGIAPIPAHMFVFYFGCLSAVTPPVAVSSIVAAGLAKSSVSKTGWLAGRLAIAGFIVPFMYVFEPALLLMGDSPVGMIMPLVTSFVGVVSLSAAIEGYFLCQIGPVLRLIFGIAAILLLIPEMYTDIAGIILAIMGLYMNYRMKQRSV
jgi:TRAP transporter 4TM/12TM fusion protein